MDQYVVIVAGGKGLRMGSEIPKQFLLLKEKPILMHTMEKFKSWNKEVQLILVLPQNQLDYWEALQKKHQFSIDYQLALGGESRFHSVKNGLSLVPKNALVGVHDAVRPLVSITTIQNTFTEAQKSGNAIPYSLSVDSLRILEGKESKIIDRTKVVKIQTPQVFQSTLLLVAFEQDFKAHFTDDASVLESAGYKINLVKGNDENIKITQQSDLKLAAAMLGDVQ